MCMRSSTVVLTELPLCLSSESWRELFGGIIMGCKEKQACRGRELDEVGVDVQGPRRTQM